MRLKLGLRSDKAVPRLINAQIGQARLWLFMLHTTFCISMPLKRPKITEPDLAMAAPSRLNLYVPCFCLVSTRPVCCPICDFTRDFPSNSEVCLRKPLASVLWVPSCWVASPTSSWVGRIRCDLDARLGGKKQETHKKEKTQEGTQEKGRKQKENQAACQSGYTASVGSLSCYASVLTPETFSCRPKGCSLPTVQFQAARTNERRGGGGGGVGIVGALLVANMKKKEEKAAEKAGSPGGGGGVGMVRTEFGSSKWLVLERLPRPRGPPNIGNFRQQLGMEGTGQGRNSGDDTAGQGTLSVQVFPSPPKSI